MNKTVSIIITISLILAVGLVLASKSRTANQSTTATSTAPAVEIKNGVQYVRINAKGGYFPKISTAKAGIPTKLIVQTNGTYDCSASLVIHSINYQNILPQTGETEIDLGTPKAGEPLRGLCGMGMYNFLVNFE